MALTFYLEDQTTGKQSGRDYQTFRGARRAQLRLGEYNHIIRKRLEATMDPATEFDTQQRDIIIAAYGKDVSLSKIEVAIERLLDEMESIFDDDVYDPEELQAEIDACNYVIENFDEAELRDWLSDAANDCAKLTRGVKKQQQQR